LDQLAEGHAEKLEELSLVETRIKQLTEQYNEEKEV
jgi:hypothetical protein